MGHRVSPKIWGNIKISCALPEVRAPDSPIRSIDKKLLLCIKLIIICIYTCILLDVYISFIILLYYILYYYIEELLE